MNRVKIYLDNCCFNRPYDDQSYLKTELETKAKLFIQNLVLTNEIDLIWSYMLDYENSKNIHTQKKRVIQKWQSLCICDIDETDEILKISKEIQRTGIKSADSLHISCAICAGADYFISVDRRILRYKSERIEICDPIEFLKRWEGDYDD